MLCVAWHAAAQTQTQTQTQTAQVSSSEVAFGFYGFKVDMSRLNQQQQMFMTPVLSAQLEVILKADLPPIMLAFMKTIPVVVDPGLPGAGTPALFMTDAATGRGVVKTSLVPMPSDKPIYSKILW